MVEETEFSRVHGPGERVPVSGIYNVVNEDHEYLDHQKTCVEGEPFPPTVDPKAFGYVIERKTRHMGDEE